MRLVLLLTGLVCLFVSINRVHSLTVEQTRNLWELCRNDDECRSSYNIEAPYSVGTTPLDDGDTDIEQLQQETQNLLGTTTEMQLLPQFRAFMQIVSRQCAVREAPGDDCSDYQLGLLERLTTDPLIASLWIARLRVWVVDSGVGCMANQIMIFNNRTSSLECRCRINKQCHQSSGDGGSLVDTIDGMTIKALIIALVVIGALELLSAVWSFLRKRLWWQKTAGQRKHRASLADYLNIPSSTPNTGSKAGGNSLLHSSSGTEAPRHQIRPGEGATRSGGSGVSAPVSSSSTSQIGTFGSKGVIVNRRTGGGGT